MKIKVLIAALILGTALPAAAEFTTVAEAYEVLLPDLRLPQHKSGTIAFKTCEECKYQVERVNENTQWVLNGQRLSLEKFRRGVLGIADRKNASVTVLHHLEQDRVTRVTVTTY